MVRAVIALTLAATVSGAAPPQRAGVPPARTTAEVVQLRENTRRYEEAMTREKLRTEKIDTSERVPGTVTNDQVAPILGAAGDAGGADCGRASQPPSGSD
jgi:hypothetical protein